MYLLDWRFVCYVIFGRCSRCSTLYVHWASSCKHVLLFSVSPFFATDRLFRDFNQEKTNYFILRHEKKTMNQPKKNKKSESISDSTAHPKRRRWWVKKSNILSVNKYLIFLFLSLLNAQTNRVVCFYFSPHGNNA